VRDSFRVLLTGLTAFVLVVGAAMLLSGLQIDERAVVLTGEARFPDQSTGNQAGFNPANEVGIRVSFATVDPWIQGQPHDLTPAVDTSPGAGVASVDLTTLILYLERPSVPRRDIVNSDLVLLEPAGPNRWASMDGPMHIYPNADVTGSNFFLSFSISLNVNYTNGRSYGWGGWDPGVRIVAPAILLNLVPIGLVLFTFGVIGTVLLLVAWLDARKPAPAPQ